MVTVKYRNFATGWCGGGGGLAPNHIFSLTSSERHREAKMQNTAGVVSRTKLSVFDSPLSSRVEDT